MKNDKTHLIFSLLIAAIIAGPAFADSPLLLNGAGATFPYPLYSKWFDVYSKVDPSVRFNYQSIGSGGGIRQISERTVDFGATDGPMTDEQLGQAKGGEILHFPTALGAVVITYNLEGIESGLKLTPELVADLFLGKIARWNDPRIGAVNPDRKLPDQHVAVVHRADGSGTTYIFTDYLSKVSEPWSKQVGRGTAVSWPTGLGGKGNEGVTGLVKQTPGAVGYVELIYAMSNRLPYAQLKNRAGTFVEPTIASVTSAAAASDGMPDDFRVSITDAEGEDAYPISGFTWLLVYANQTDAAKGRKLVEFLSWMMHDGQPYAAELHYAPLPASVVGLEEKALGKVTHDGKPIASPSRGR